MGSGDTELAQAHIRIWQARLIQMGLEQDRQGFPFHGSCIIFFFAKTHTIHKQEWINNKVISDREITKRNSPNTVKGTRS